MINKYNSLALAPNMACMLLVYILVAMVLHLITQSSLLTQGHQQNDTDSMKDSHFHQATSQDRLMQDYRQGMHVAMMWLDFAKFITMMQYRTQIPNRFYVRARKLMREV